MRTPGPRKTSLLCAMIIACLNGLASPAHAQDADAVATVDDLMWTTRSNGAAVSWDEADEYCETLELEGHGDWRLPTLVEVESLYEPDADQRGRIRSPFELSDCCAWSSVNLVELEAETKGVLPDPTNPPAGYYWGFLFSSGIRYYSFARFPDGEALCVREAVGS